MKSIISLLLVIIALLLCLCSCTFSTDTGKAFDISTGEIIDERFIKVYGEKSFYILADKETKVQYIVYAVGYKGGITVLLDGNGKPLLYEGEVK